MKTLPLLVKGLAAGENGEKAKNCRVLNVDRSPNPCLAVPCSVDRHPLFNNGRFALALAKSISNIYRRPPFNFNEDQYCCSDR